LEKYRYFQGPYVVAFTLSPDDPLTYTDRIRALIPDCPGAPRRTADFPAVPSGKYWEAAATRRRRRCARGRGAEQGLSHVATFGFSSGTASVRADTNVYGGTAAGLQVTGVDEAGVHPDHEGALCGQFKGVRHRTTTA